MLYSSSIDLHQHDVVIGFTYDVSWVATFHTIQNDLARQRVSIFDSGHVDHSDE